MTRPTITVLKASRIPAGRDGLWTLIRRMRKFTVTELQGETGHHITSVRTFIRALAAAGYLKSTERKIKRFPHIELHYELVRDTGQETPRLKRDGSPVEQGRNRENMWRAMKMLNVFTPYDLAAAATTEEHPVTVPDAKDYIKHLNKAGYFAIVSAGAPGKQASYRLLFNTGPKPPMVQRVKHVFDQNLKAVVWPRPEVDLNTAARGRR